MCYVGIKSRTWGALSVSIRNAGDASAGAMENLYTRFILFLGAHFICMCVCGVYVCVCVSVCGV